MTIRRARIKDVDAIGAIISAAYAHYVERIGRRPGPMEDDHLGRVVRGEAFVAEDGGHTVGTVVLVDAADHLVLTNLAVDPAHQHRGLGRALLAFAEDEARRRGFRVVRLWTHVTMTENLALYARLGYVEEDRRPERVFLAKDLGGASLS